MKRNAKWITLTAVALFSLIGGCSETQVGQAAAETVVNTILANIVNGVFTAI